MMRSKASKDSSRGFQVNSEISFLINIRKILPISGQTFDVILESKIFIKNTPDFRHASTERSGGSADGTWAICEHGPQNRRSEDLGPI